MRNYDGGNVNGSKKKIAFWRNDNVVRLRLPNESSIRQEATTFRTNQGHVGTLQEARQNQEVSHF